MLQSHRAPVNEKEVRPRKMECYGHTSLSIETASTGIDAMNSDAILEDPGLHSGPFGSFAEQSRNMSRLESWKSFRDPVLLHDERRVLDANFPSEDFLAGPLGFSARVSWRTWCDQGG